MEHVENLVKSIYVLMVPDISQTVIVELIFCITQISKNCVLLSEKHFKVELLFNRLFIL